MRGEKINGVSDSPLPEAGEIPVHVLTIDEGLDFSDIGPRDTVTIELISGRKIDVPASTVLTIDRQSIISGNLPDGPYLMLDGETVVIIEDGKVTRRSDDVDMFGDTLDTEL